MRLNQPILPYKADYPEHLSSYLEQIKEAIRQKKHHDQRRSLFMNFLRLSYGVDAQEVEIEEKVKVGKVQGYIDALFRFVIIEFKTDLERERPAAFIELRKYLAAQTKPTEYLSLITDGLRFELYQLGDKGLDQITTFELVENDPLYSYRALDNIIFASKRITPKSVDITTRFGSGSAVFRQSLRRLLEMYAKVKNESSVKVKIDEWNSLLSRVYGEPLGDTELFLRHTYLTVFSRLLVANALFPGVKRTSASYKGILTGTFFAKNNLPNLVEPDFFSWAIDTSVESDFVGLLSKLDAYLSPFKLDAIGEDLLKEIYQDLVDPQSRHSLGEYYTPDWIADLTLKTLGYKAGRILDPACGSGSFLMAVIRSLRRDGHKGGKLAKLVLESVVGLDVHPLAVMMTKANVVLGIAREIKAIDTDVYLPIYMADTLLVSEDPKKRSLKISISEDEAFFIPFETMERGLPLDGLIDNMAAICAQTAHSNDELKHGLAGFERASMTGASEFETFIWRNNFKLFAKLIRQNRDSIWSFILKNAYRPAFLRRTKVDYIVGNPPWLSYRYIKDKNYKKAVKDLTFQYQLLSPKSGNLFTQMDTSTLFFVYCETQFLKPGGKIAFVMPKTTILPAKQHLDFQKRGLTEIHDFTGISPLFNVRSVLLVRNGQKGSCSKVPTVKYEGTLPTKNLTLESAKKHLTVSKGDTTFHFGNAYQSYYYPRFLQGATIVPRCFWFVEPDEEAAVHKDAPHLASSEEALKESKHPWNMKMVGRIEKQFMYETVLAKGLLPFAVSRTEMVFLPLIKLRESFSIADSQILMEQGYHHAAKWLRESEKLWESNRQTEDRSLIQRLNYNQTLVKQNVWAPYIVLYNTSGTNITASLYVREKEGLGSFVSYGFLAESVTYYYYPATVNEGYYLTAVLNSDVVNDIIKELQPQGLYGERHIHRRPFEACAIPQFDSNNSVHFQLVELGQNCREIVASFVPNLEGRLGQVRLDVRKIIKREIAKINKLVKKLLAEEGQKVVSSPQTGGLFKNGDLFGL